MSSPFGNWLTRLFSVFTRTAAAPEQNELSPASASGENIDSSKDNAETTTASSADAILPSVEETPKASVLDRDENKSNFHCPDDQQLLLRIGEKKASKPDENGESVVFPMLFCPKCEQYFTSVKTEKHLQKIRLGGQIYRNLLPEEEKPDPQKHTSSPNPQEKRKGANSCYLYLSALPTNCPFCGQSYFFKRTSYYSNAYRHYFPHYCISCETDFVPYAEYRSHKNDWDPINPEIIQGLEKSFQKQREKQSEQAIRARERENQLREYQKKRDLEEQKLKERRLRNSQEAAAQKIQTRQTASLQQQEKLYSHDNTIRVKDFVVRRTVLKCRHNNHRLQNIDGLINILDKDGKIHEAHVPAGYCPNCNLFIIMEYNYQYLRFRGTLLCRISDEATYLSGKSSSNGMQLAQESILKQYGYNVSQQENLTAASRQAILSILVDNNVLTKNEIISYLDFFINQRKHRKNYEYAIDKWKSDREFISRYRTGEYTQYRIGSITRKY